LLTALQKELVKQIPQIKFKIALKKIQHMTDSEIEETREIIADNGKVF
jgi:hypothetical protein